jgi:ATP diphosphatase
MAALVRTMDTLRGPHGCSWDKKQTHASLAPFLLEETYEALEAIDRRDFAALPSELGDVLFQCVFHAQIATERGRFDMADAILAISAKIVRRHPHVFTPSGKPLSAAARRRQSVKSPEAVIQQWERLKAYEQAEAGARKRVLAGVPRTLPALLRAHEIGTRVGSVGFDWNRATDVLDKIEEEVRELRAAVHDSPSRATEEFGDLLFAIANLGRKLGLESETALRQANDKFSRRFDALEEWFETRGRSVHQASTEELERAWQEIKGVTG